MSRKANGIPAAAWEAILPKQKELQEHAEKLMKSVAWENAKPFKQVVQMQYGTTPSSSFKAIQGITSMKGDIMRAISYDLGLGDVTPNMSKAERQGRLCKYFYYSTPEDQKHGEEMAKGPVTPFKPMTFLLHQIVESGVMLVSNREFVALRVALDQSTAATKKYVVYTLSVDVPGVEFEKKVVRGQITNCNVYEETAPGEFTCQLFFHCDPCGSIPAAVFTSTLEGQMDYLVTLKDFIEKK